MSGADIMDSTQRLRGDDLRAAFSGRTHYGTYLYAAGSDRLIHYTEQTRKDGTLTYAHSSGPIDGVWTVSSDTICYRYASEAMSGGCFSVHERGGCYYYFSNQTRYDGYSVIITKDAPKSNACEPLIG